MYYSSHILARINNTSFASDTLSVLSCSSVLNLGEVMYTSLRTQCEF